MSEYSSESTTIPRPSSQPTVTRDMQKTTSDSHHVQITTIKLNGDNFLRWSQSVRMYIRGRGKMGYLTGDKKAPSEDAPMYATWDAENSMVMTWLVNSMEEEIGANYMCFPTAYELWENINKIYFDLGNQSQIFELTLKLCELRQGEETVTKYFNSLKRIWQDLDLFDAYEWKNVEDGHHHKKTMEDDHIFKFLVGLNVEFNEVRGRIIGRRPLPPLGEVFSEVRREESRRNVMLGKKGPAATIEGSALASTGLNMRRGAANLRKPEEKPNVWCDYCNRPRHTRETCWKINGKPANFKGRTREKTGRAFPNANEAETTASTINKEQLEQLLALVKSNPSSSAPSVSMAHTGSEINAFSCGFGISTPWIIDSGESDHMTNSLNLLKLYSPCSKNRKVRIVDGSFSPIAGKGLVQISEKIDLKSVLYVPKLNCNLLSVSKLSKDSNCRVVFCDSHCIFQSRSSGKTIGSARMVNGLYYFENILPGNKIVQGLSSISSLLVHDQIMVWHCRLGHPSFSYMKHLLPDLFEKMNPLDFQCECCVLAKSQRRTYVSKPYLESKPFYLFHSDVRGPSKGENNIREQNFWEISEPLSNLVIDQPLNFQNEQNGESESTIVDREIDLSEKEILRMEKNRNILEPVVYSRRNVLKRSKDELTIPAQASLKAPGKRTMDTPGTDLFPYQKKNIPLSVISVPSSAFTTNISKYVGRRNIQEALEDQDWRLAVFEEMKALKKNGTWEIVEAPKDQKILDVKNAFLNGDLDEEVFMRLPLGFEPEFRLGKAVKRLGYVQSQADHTMFYKHSKEGKTAVLIVYIDDIILTGSDYEELGELKERLAKEFEVKNLGLLKYFLGMEFARSKEGIFVNQRKYVLDLLTETGMLGCKPAEPPMEPNVKLQPAGTKSVKERERYRRLVEKLIYLSHTRPDIAFPVSVVSQFMHSLGSEHFETVYRILRYMKRTPGKGLLFKRRGHLQVEAYTDADWAGSLTDRRSTSGYCSFLGGNLVTWRSKKQNVVARSSAEAEFRSLAHRICEVLWIKKLLLELKISESVPMKMHCDNKAAVSIAHNPVLHDRTKHVEIDKHFIKEKIDNSVIFVDYVPTNEQVADLITKGIHKRQFELLVSKLGMEDILKPA
ncbi:uncharacterized protein [Primulina eburnea]|uniref:uncharacterized protein n=1 Tax=Primulina eburnea TaxID=1245227 RepID=UPI003C6C6F79